MPDFGDFYRWLQSRARSQAELLYWPLFILCLYVISPNCWDSSTSWYNRSRICTAEASWKTKIIVFESWIHKRISKFTRPLRPKNIYSIQVNILSKCRYFNRLSIKIFQILSEFVPTYNINCCPSSLLHFHRAPSAITGIMMPINCRLDWRDQIL